MTRAWAIVPALTGCLIGCLGGCLSTPAFAPESGVSYAEDGPGATITAPGLALHFAKDGFHFPDGLVIDGADVMGRAPSPGCADEDEAGFLIAPTPRISAHGPATQVTNRLVPTLRGPAVVQARLDWATRLTCNSERAPGGTSTFTMFPDGRIVRHDLLNDPSSAEISASQCACDKGDGFTVSAYWTVDRAPFRELYAPGPGALPNPKDGSITNQATACLDAVGYQLAFAWRDGRGTTIKGSDAVVGFGREMVFGASKLEAYTWENSTEILVGRKGCVPALASAAAHVGPSPLTIIDATRQVMEMPAAVDGIYGGDRGDGHPGIDLGADRAELTGPIDSSFAVWLRFPHTVDAVRATLENARGAWYLPQQIDGRTWLIWFRDSISAGQKIVVEPR